MCGKESGELKMGYRGGSSGGGPDLTDPNEKRIYFLPVWDLGPPCPGGDLNMASHYLFHLRREDFPFPLYIHHLTLPGWDRPSFRKRLHGI